MVAFHAMMATFTAAAIQSAFGDIAEDLGVSVHRASYLTSLVIAVLGAAPLIWMPLSNRYGRRPIFLLSLICSLVGNVGCAKSYSYATMGLCRAITGFFISPPAAIGSAVVAETFFKKDRARCMGVWAVMVTVGVPLAPLIFGFVAIRVGYRWIYWTLAIVCDLTRFVKNANRHRRTVFNFCCTSPLAPNPFISAATLQRPPTLCCTDSFPSNGLIRLPSKYGISFNPWQWPPVLV